jgi:hypothetical protein
MIEALRCSRCGCFYNSEGRRSKAYVRSVVFKKKEGKWISICSDRKGCDSRMGSDGPVNFWFGTEHKQGRKKRIRDEET